MKHLRFLEFVSTKLVVLIIILTIVVVPVTFVIVVKSGLSDISTLATFVDAVFKTIALLVGAVWALNRFYITRADASHLKVDADVSCIRSSGGKEKSSDYSLLIYRLDIINTGKTLIEPFQHFVEVQAVTLSNGSVDYTTIHRWPESGMHPGGSIEPGSWSAINDAIAIPSHLQAVRLFIYIDLRNNSNWSWHKTFDISASDEKRDQSRLPVSKKDQQEVVSTRSAGRGQCPQCGYLTDLHACKHCGWTACLSCWQQKGEHNCPGCGKELAA